MARVLDTRRSRLLLVALVFVHLVVISQQVETGGATLLEHALFVALSPVQEVAAGGVRGVRAAWAGYVDLRSVRDENRVLRERLREVETLLQARQHEAGEAAHLREILGLREKLPFETIVAEVVTRDGVPWFRTLILDKGRDEGVRLNAAVISPSGVVGRVVELGPHAAKAQLLLDRNSAAGVVTERRRVTGVVVGQVSSSEGGQGDLVMKYVSALADVAVEDVVVTSGFDRIFPKGLVVGRIHSVGPPSGLFREVLVTPSARFDQLEQVLVLKGTAPASTLDSAVQ